MAEFFITILIIFYALAILFVLFHSLFDAHLIFHYIRSKIKGAQKKAPQPITYFPQVTLQLPVYNELYVVERLLDAVSQIHWPAENLEIQVLDDSTDETTDFIAGKVALMKLKGIKVHHIRRNNRDGYKAGALKHGLSLAQGEFIAVFDSDFVPAPDFLHATIPHFYNDAIGMVQTKWGHINKSASWLTGLQAMALDGHFTIEQSGRNAGGYFINFNGTAGVWRRQAIIDAGNWQADTLTEDLDLSYRAQMAGWKFAYLEDYLTPAELPPMVSALKSQQYRWTKGGAETARKNMKKLWRSPQPLGVKMHGAFHLVYSIGFVCIILYVLLTVPLLFVKQYYPAYDVVFTFSKIAGLSFFIYILHYAISYMSSTEGPVMKRAGRFIIDFPFFVSLFIGLSFNNSLGIIKGYLGIKSSFIRTPKFNQLNDLKKMVSNKYVKTRIDWITITESLLVVYFLFGIITAVRFENFGSLPLLFMAFAGFCMMIYFTLDEIKLLRRVNG
ncbi:MAG: cellulose synthase family protein [Ferruginibacter sp.]